MTLSIHQATSDDVSEAALLFDQYRVFLGKPQKTNVVFLFSRPRGLFLGFFYAFHIRVVTFNKICCQRLLDKHQEHNFEGPERRRLHDSTESRIPSGIASPNPALA